MAAHINCADCGAQLVRPAPDEMVVNGETVGEHMNETDHQPTLDMHAEPRYDSEEGRTEHRRQVAAKRGDHAVGRLVDHPIIDDETEQPIRDDSDFAVTWVVPKEKYENAKGAEGGR